MNFQELTESFHCIFLVFGLFISINNGFTLQLGFNSEFPVVYWFENNEAFQCFGFISEEQTLLAQLLGNIFSKSCFSVPSSLISAPDLMYRVFPEPWRRQTLGRAKLLFRSPSLMSLTLRSLWKTMLPCKPALSFLDWQMGISPEVGIFTQSETVLENPNCNNFWLYLWLLWDKKQMLKEAFSS